MIKRIKFTGIPVEDQDRALKFYTQMLGFRVSTDQPYKEGERWIELQPPGGETRLLLSKSARASAPNVPAMVFVADDVEKTYQELRSKGVEFTQPPTKAPWGLHAMFKDSEGNLILLGTD
jgi:predicted enzyme related to lactoylglutathione lyase